MLAETGPDLVEQGFKAMKFRMGGEDTDAKEIGANAGHALLRLATRST